MGAVAAAFAGIWLISNSMAGTGIQTLSATVFVITLLLMLVSSTLYHNARADITRARLKVLDHCAIFLLIAGTYTPFSLIALKHAQGGVLLAVVWSLAAAGLVFKLFFTGRFKLVSTIIYVAMGWLVMTRIKPLMAAISTPCATWLLIGGGAYTLGAVVYMMKNLRYTHLIWHVFVLLGAGAHFVAVSMQVLR